MLNVISLSVIMLNVVVLNVIMLSVVMLNIIMLNVMLSVPYAKVVVPSYHIIFLIKPFVINVANQFK